MIRGEPPTAGEMAIAEGIGRALRGDLPKTRTPINETESKPMNIIGARFTKDEFADYVGGLKMPSPYTSTNEFRPQYVVLHNTANPTLAMRPHGFTTQHMLNLKAYYEGKKPPWTGGPHLFIDDRSIWVFNPLNRRGTHAGSPALNAVTWGVEMLGNYATEAFDSGRGALVRDFSVAAVAILYAKLGKSPDSLQLHEDLKTVPYDCPGKNVNRADFVQRVKDRLLGIIENPEYKLIVYRKGEGHEPYAVIPVNMVGGEARAREDALAEAIGQPDVDGISYVGVRRYLELHGYRVTFSSDERKVYAVEK